MAYKMTPLRRFVATANAVGLAVLVIVVMGVAEQKPTNPGPSAAVSARLTKKDLDVLEHQTGSVLSKTQELEKKVDALLQESKKIKDAKPAIEPSQPKRGFYDLLQPPFTLGLTMLVALAAAILSALAFKQSRRLTRALFEFERSAWRKLDRIENVEILLLRLQPLVPKQETAGGEKDNVDAEGRTKGEKKVERSANLNPTDDRRSQAPHPLPFGYGSKRKTEAPRREVRIDQSVLMGVGAECLIFPLSVEEFRLRWEDRGGDRQARIRGFPEQDGDPTVFLIDGGDRPVFAVPNTTDWGRLARTDLFKAEGQVGPGSRVKELLKVSKASPTGGGIRVDDYGIVRVDL